MFFSESKYQTNQQGPVPILPRFRRELKERVEPRPGIEKYINVYPLAERKKLAVCNVLVSLHLDGSRLGGVQSANKDKNRRIGRF